MQLESLAATVTFVLSLGATITTPLIIFLIGIVFGQEAVKSARGGIAVGIGFIGINAVLGLLIGGIAPIVEALIKVVGWRYRVIDLSWVYAFTAGVAWWGMPIAFFFFLAENMVLLALGSKRGGTDTIDVYNLTLVYAWFGLPTFYIWQSTGNLWLALGFIAIDYWYTLWLADWVAPLAQDPDTYTFPNVTFCCFQNAGPKAFVIDKYLISRIPGVKESRLDPVTMRERFGLIADPVFMGFFIGLGLGLIALSTGMISIPQCLNTIMAVAAAMLLMPRMVGILMEGLVPLGDAAKAFFEKRFPGKRVNIGLDWAIAAGNITDLAAGAMLVPTTMLLALILPGNMTIPYGDLAVIPLCNAFLFVAITKGNLLRTFLGGAVLSAFVLYLGGVYAGECTYGAAAVGLPIPEGFLATTFGESLGWWICIPPIIASYLFGGELGKKIITGEASGIKIWDPTVLFTIAVVWWALDFVCWWLCKDDPIRTRYTPKEEFYKKGMKSIEDVRKVMEKTK